VAIGMQHAAGSMTHHAFVKKLYQKINMDIFDLTADASAPGGDFFS
jgi:hypothetical protein